MNDESTMTDQEILFRAIRLWLSQKQQEKAQQEQQQPKSNSRGGA